MWKKFAKVISMGSLAGLIIAKLRGVRINPPALRILLAILVAMASFVGSSMVVLFAGTWLIFLLVTDVARLAGINLSLFLPAEKGKNKETDKNAQPFRLPKIKGTEEIKPAGAVKNVPVEAENKKLSGTEKKAAVEVNPATQAEPASGRTAQSEISFLGFIPEWMRVDKKVFSVLFSSHKKDDTKSEDLALFHRD